MNDKHFQSLLAALNGAPWVNADLRRQCIDSVVESLEELLEKHEIDDVETDEVEEVAAGIIDDLAMQEYRQDFDN